MDEREFLTVTEVMAHLRMGRTFVYQEARRYLATGGAAGIPCRKFGRMLRFPVTELRTYATAQRPTSTIAPVPGPAPRPARRPRTAPRSNAQPTLPFTASDAS